uniref:Uncharacterized protein n=1 Tax=Picea glauca TaxID=3330 RepID=A0A101LUY6_PICGL|nr:hypothetical protein ABT39_MTgene2198 [Picea glauca]QHR87810.1 hypothetical protein Q903MT_gene1822 [Picea sitchensis]
MESDVLFKKNGILRRYNLLLGRALASWLGFMEKMGGWREGCYVGAVAWYHCLD